MTTKKGLIYYSLSGNTKSMIDKVGFEDFEIINITSRHIDLSEIDLLQYEVLLIATSTLGDGEPPAIFKRLAPQLKALKGKRIGLFGSGNSVYRYYCGALDLLEGLLRRQNEILFTYKFEEYPTEKAVNDFKKLIQQTFRETA